VSYDLEVRSRPPHSRGVPRETFASFLASLPGVVRTDLTSFELDRRDSGVALSIDIGHQTADDDEPSTRSPEFVNYALFLLPYPFLDKTGPVALQMAFELAEELDWSVHDLQAERELSRDSLPDALRLQRAHGQVAREVLERAVAADLSLGELFMQEMWNHTLVSMAGCVVLAAIGSGWLLLTLERPMKDFDRYMPWGVSIGAVILMWVKGLAQAVVLRRRLRRQAAVLGSPRNHGAA
jgi:hypothetical protein